MKRAEKDFITVGLIAVTTASTALARLEVRLSEADRGQAERFRRVEDRARFVLGRALLARLLAEDLEYRPPVLDLALTDQGRPYLAAFPDVSFSISHAGDWVAVTLTLGAQVGIDIEALDRRVDLEALAERIFNPADLACFRELARADQARAFFRAWTGKEAVLKAKGVGLSGGVREIRVPLKDTPSTMQDLAEVGTIWHIHPLAVAEGYVASLACNRDGNALTLRRLTLSDLD